jgi:hypothetical protein
MIEMFSTQTKNLSEQNKCSIISYIHRRVIKVSNNFFEVPLRGEGDVFKSESVFATTVTPSAKSVADSAALDRMLVTMNNRLN